MKRNISLLAFFTFLALPSVAQANMGTPLMLTRIFHLVIGNFIIGIVEGKLLARFFGLPQRKCIALMIIANYLSAWLGGFFIGRTIIDALPIGLYTAWPIFWFMVAVTYILTLLIEFPFVAFAFRGSQSWWRKSLHASLLIQSITYVGMIGWYLLISWTSLYTKTNVVELSSISLPENVCVYFISTDDGDVYTGSLREAKWKNIYNLNSLHKNDRLLVQPSDTDTNAWDLMACLERNSQPEHEIIAVKKGFAVITAPSTPSIASGDPANKSTWLNYGLAPKLGEAQSSEWVFKSGFWPAEGLSGIKDSSGQEISISFETPYIVWAIRNVTHLPTDKVLLQLGNDQICVYDPESKKIALLAHGRGPIAVIRKAQQNAPRAEK